MPCACPGRPQGTACPALSGIAPTTKHYLNIYSKKLQQLYSAGTGAARYPPEVADAFFDKMAVIRAARDENDLRALKSLHFEKLQGERGLRGERSIRLNRQFRLILRLEIDEQGKTVYVNILDIVDYH